MNDRIQSEPDIASTGLSDSSWPGTGKGAPNFNESRYSAANTSCPTTALAERKLISMSYPDQVRQSINLRFDRLTKSPRVMSETLV